MTTKITDANLDSNVLDNTNFNIGLLGFKMAVNEGLTVFNLVDGVVDEFNDESGTDEAEGSNDTYCGTGDFYKNQGSPISYSAGFTTTTITEPDTSTAGTNPDHNVGTFGSFTVPANLTSLSFKMWGGGGGTGAPGAGNGGGGGFVSGALGVSPGQTLYVGVAEGGNDANDNNEEAANTSPFGAAIGGTNGRYDPGSNPGSHGGNGGGGSGIMSEQSIANYPAYPGTRGTVPAPSVYAVASGGGGGGSHCGGSSPNQEGQGGGGGGLTGFAGGEFGNCYAQTIAAPSHPQAGQGGGQAQSGGGGDQEQGGQGGGNPGEGEPGGFMFGGDAFPGRSGSAGSGASKASGGGGGGYYGGGGSSGDPGAAPVHGLHGGGGSSFYGHPQITGGATTGAAKVEGGGVADPAYVAGTNEGFDATNIGPSNYPGGGIGEDGYVLLTGTACGATTSTTIVSNAFTSTSVATSARIVVFQENIDTPTLNTDVIASVSRDGTNFTNATLSDSGYVTGSSGQRILTGQADISGQPSGQSMRWKLALANNAVKIHGVSLQWS